MLPTAFNVLAPFYADVEETPEYLSNTTAEVSTDNYYWCSRMIAAMADASYRTSVFHIERYQESVMAKGHALINRYDALLEQESDPEKADETESGSKQKSCTDAGRKRQRLRLIRYCMS